MTAQVIIANCITVLVHVLDFYFGYKYRDKPTILKANILTSSMSVITYIILGGWAGVISSLTTIARLITIYYKDKKNQKFHFAFIAFCLAYLSSISDWTGWYVVLLVISMYCSFLPKWFSKNTQYMRLGGLFANILLIPYQILVKNYASVPMNIFNIITISISFIKWYRLDKSSYKKTE